MERLECLKRDAVIANAMLAHASECIDRLLPAMRGNDDAECVVYEAIDKLHDARQLLFDALKMQGVDLHAMRPRFTDYA